jgi:hypothetical protein
MKYPDGQVAHLGDVVSLAGKPGHVVFSIDTDEYAPEYPKAEWAYLGKGVMAEFVDFGLIYYPESEPDLQLVRRTNASDSIELRHPYSKERSDRDE